MSIRFDDEIAQHLHRFRVDQLDVSFHDHRFHKVLMDQFATCLPLLAVLHQKHVVSSSNDTITDVRIRSMVVQIGLLIE